MWAFNAADPGELLSMHHTKSCLKQMIPDGSVTSAKVREIVSRKRQSPER